MSITQKIFYLLPAMLLSACALGPDYERPTSNMPQGFSESIGLSTVEMSNLPWWEIYQDERLQHLIKTALDQNKDIAIALARIEAAQASLQFTRADLFPRIDASGSAQRLNPSNETLNFAVNPRNDFGIFGNLSYELDLWGKIRRATEAERAQLMSTEFTYHTILINLVADVANTYFTILGLDDRIAISKVTWDNRKDATNLIRERFKKGIIPELDVNQAEIEEANAAIAYSVFDRQLRQNEHALSVLLGNMPTKIERGQSLVQQALPVPELLPASLLERRPDVRASEEFLRSQVARIGVAQAKRLPSINILGFIGLGSSETSDLFNKEATTWSIGSDFLGPLLDFGKSRSEVDLAKAEAQAALKSYEQSVIQAVREVDDALVGIRTYTEENASRKFQVEAARNAAKLARARYDQGVTSYLEVLDIERSLFEAELGASQSREAYLQAIVGLYKALGGGWDNI